MISQAEKMAGAALIAFAVLVATPISSAIDKGYVAIIDPSNPVMMADWVGKFAIIPLVVALITAGVTWRNHGARKTVRNAVGAVVVIPVAVIATKVALDSALAPPGNHSFSARSAARQQFVAEIGRSCMIANRVAHVVTPVPIEDYCACVAEAIVDITPGDPQLAPEQLTSVGARCAAQVPPEQHW